jgi:hypothetical protein
MRLGLVLSLILPSLASAVEQNATRPRSETIGVMRAVVAHFAQQQPRSERLACVATDDRTLGDILRAPAPVDPPTEVLRGIQSTGVAVEPASVCADDDANGFRVRGQRRSGGFILTFGRFRWLTPDRVEVPLLYCCWAGSGTAELERAGGAWRVAQLEEWTQS